MFVSYCWCMMLFDRVRLRLFVQRVYSENHQYHASRRQLYAVFCDAINDQGDLDVPIQLVIQVRLYLMTRSDDLTDTKKFAFENAIANLSELL